MPDIDRNALERPFDQDKVKTRKGNFGKRLSYVEAHEYIRRLNEVFGSRWDFEIVEHEVLDNEVVVVGKLTAGGIVKMAFGTSSITRTKETGEAVSIGDDLKAASSDALKKAASLLGIGLDLYAGKANPNGDDNGNRGRRVHGPPRNGGGGSNGNEPRLTQKQLAAVWALADSKDIDREKVRNFSMEEWAVQPEFLTKAQASELISRLQRA